MNEKRLLVKLAGAVMLLAVLAISAGPAQAESIRGRMNLGLNYPGVSFRYGLADNIAVEFKAQVSEGTTVLGPRVYYFFGRPAANTDIYLGIENAVIFFEGDDSEGKGLAQVFFAGAEYQINPAISISADIGPGLILLNDSDTSQSDFTTSIIAHVSINYFLN